MLDGGCDPLYIARRLVRIASEDIGNADPRALSLSMEGWQVQERLGSPEGELTLAQVVTYLALAPKSIGVYRAYNECMALVRRDQDRVVPVHLRNAPTSLMKEQGYGAEYRYAHDEPEAFAAGESYMPETWTAPVSTTTPSQGAGNEAGRKARLPGSPQRREHQATLYPTRLKTVNRLFPC